MPDDPTQDLHEKPSVVKKNIKEELNTNKNSVIAHHHAGYGKNYFKSYMEYIKNRKRENNLNRVKNMRSNGGNLSQNTKIGDISDNMSIKEEENKQEKKNFMKKKVMEDKI